MKKHKKLFIILIVFGVIILVNATVYVISNWHNPFASKISASANTSDFKNYSNAKMGFSLIYPNSWTIDEQDDAVAINPASHGGITYFSVAERNDFHSLDDVKKALAPEVMLTPIQIDTGSGFEYADTDSSESIWLSHSNKIYIIRAYEMSDAAQQILSTFKFEN